MASAFEATKKIGRPQLMVYNNPLTVKRRRKVSLDSVRRGASTTLIALVLYFPAAAAPEPADQTVPSASNSADCPCKTQPNKQKPAVKSAPCPSCQCHQCEDEFNQAQAVKKAKLGTFLIGGMHYSLALNQCQDALKLDPGSELARTCLVNAIDQLKVERKTKLSALLLKADTLIWQFQADKALEEMSKIQAELAPVGSPLGEFDDSMNIEIGKRLDAIKGVALISRLPSIGVTLLKIFGLLLLLWFALLVASFVYRSLERRWKYRLRLATADHIDWTVWSIYDESKRGDAGPLMDALNPSSNPLLRRKFAPSSLLLVPPMDDILGPGDSKLDVWRDFLDDPREAIDIEELPIEKFLRHRFLQVEAFEEMDFKFGGFDAKGLVGLFRNIRRWLDRGMPAAQATVYHWPVDTASKHACVRITCNWTASVLGQPKTSPDSSPNPDLTDETNGGDTAGQRVVSVFASSEDDPAIDAMALSAQRAAFKLYYRLATNTTPNYTTAVACFHQGVSLLDQYL